MIHSLAKVVQIIAAGGTASSSMYYLLCLWSAKKFERERKAEHVVSEARSESAHSSLPVSILKPLKGTDPEIYESFRSHCLQDYPEFEIIFGVSDPKDPAIALV